MITRRERMRTKKLLRELSYGDGHRAYVRFIAGRLLDEIEEREEPNPIELCEEISIAALEIRDLLEKVTECRTK